MATLEGRHYDSSDLKELMDNAGGWARNWDDVLWYVRTVADYDADFAKDEIPDLSQDIENLKQKGVAFTTDYRKVYQAITGKDCADCPEPEGVKSHGVHPREMADKWLHGLAFPAKKSAAVEKARSNDSPARVVEVLNKIEDQQYESIGSLLEAVGDVTWDHD